MPKKTATKAATPRQLRASPKTAALIAAYRQKLAIGGRYYEQAGQIMDELLAILPPGKPVGIGDGLRAEMVDLFASTNKIFKPQACMRFELRIIDAAGKPVRLRDKKRTAKKKAATKTSGNARPRLKIVRP
jgi:hypothetical protein